MTARRFICLAAIILTHMGICLGAEQDAPTTAGFDVRGYGAKGDGKQDDTAAFQNAMEQCAKSGGGVVTVPAGKYLIQSHLSIPPSVTLEGTWRAPATVQNYHDPKDSKGAPQLTGSVLLAVEGEGKATGNAFISLHTNSTLKGVTIFYPNQIKANPPKPYPWTVESDAADNCAIVDVLMVNPYNAVDFGHKPSGRHYIRNLYAQALYRGVYVDRCLDVGRLENVHIWPFWTAGDEKSPIADFMLEKGEAFIFARSDWEYVVNCFAIGYGMGIHFERGGEDKGPMAGPGNYLLTQSGADMSRVAVQIDETQAHSGISFSNSQIFGDLIVSKTNAGMVRFDGCGFFGSIDAGRGTAQARIDGRGRVSFSNCHFYAIHPGAGKAPHLIQALGGRLSINGCVFINSKKTADVANPIPIVLESPVISAVILGNEFYGEGTIINHARGRVEIANNIERTDEEPYPPSPKDAATSAPQAKP